MKMSKKRHYIYLTSSDSQKTGINTLGYWTGKTMTFQNDCKMPYCTPHLDRNTKGFDSIAAAVSTLSDAISENNYAKEVLGYYQIVSVTTITLKKGTLEIQISKKSKQMELK